MKVTIRTLQQKKFEVEVEPHETVLDLKQKVGSEQGEPPEHLKLFYAGRTLMDNQKSIESLNIKENTYLVVMIPRTANFESGSDTTKVNSGVGATRSASFPPLPVPPRANFTDSAPPTHPAPSTSFSAPSHTPDPKPSVALQSSTFDSDNRMSGSSMFGRPASEDSLAVEHLVDMGFERDQVMKALKASFGNTERALEYLTTDFPGGLPEAFSRPFGISSNPFSGPFPSAGAGPSGSRPPDTLSISGQTKAPSRPVDSKSTLPGPSTVLENKDITLESLRDDPMVQQIRELAGQDPDLIGPLLERLAQSKLIKPQVTGLIASNPEAFARLFLPGAKNSHEEPITHAVSVSNEEKEALDRLESMGFSRASVVQAYFASDKSEEAAAIYLMENCDDD